MKIDKTRFYGWLLTSFFWLVQLNDIQRVLWFFHSLMSDGELAAWLMTVVVELGMGLLSLDLLRRITANNQRQKRDGKFVGYKQPTVLLWFSIMVLGILETFISVSFFYEFGQVTRATERWLGGDTAWTAIVFGSVSTVLTFVFAAVEGERTRIEQRKNEKEKEQAERKRKKAEAASDHIGAVRSVSGRVGALQEQSLTAQERVVAVLEVEPGATGARVAELADCSESYARKVKRSYKEKSGDTGQ